MNRPLAGSAALLLTGEAFAQGPALLVSQSLAWFGLAAGLLAGAFAGYRQLPRSAIWPAFGIYLGVLAMVASTRAGSMEIVPLVLVLGAAAGIVPFAAAWFLVRWCWRRWRSRGAEVSQDENM